MPEMLHFLSDGWIDALAAAASDARPSDTGLEAGVEVVIEQQVEGGPTYRLVVTAGAVRVERPNSGAAEADVRLSTDRATAAAIARGERAALDAFMSGDLVVSGDTATLVGHRTALEALGDLFARVRERTTFD